MTVGVFGNADDTSRDGALEVHRRGKIACARSAEVHWDTEALSRSEDNVCAPLAWRREEYETHQVGRYGNTCAGSLGTLHKVMVAIDTTLLVGVLDDSSEDLVRKVKGLVVSYDDLHALLGNACLNDRLRRGKDTLVDEELVGARLLLLSRTLVVEHEGSFGTCGSFVE